MTTTYIRRLTMWLSGAIVLLASTVATGLLGQPASIRQRPARGLAIARVTGAEMRVYPFDSSPHQVPLRADYLSSAFMPGGDGLVGYGFPKMQGEMEGHNADIIITRDFGRSERELAGFNSAISFSVSPGGRYLAAIATNIATGFRGLQIIPLESQSGADRSLPVQIQAPTLNLETGWSPDGRKLLFSVQGRLRMFDTATKSTSELRAGSKPSWSPDGKWIAFIGQRSSLFLMSTTTGRVLLVAPGRRFVSGAAWSPDAKWILAAADWGQKDRVEGCYANSRLLVYSVPNLSSSIVLDPCSFKPELFGWVSNWPIWSRQ